MGINDFLDDHFSENKTITKKEIQTFVENNRLIIEPLIFRDKPNAKYTRPFYRKLTQPGGDPAKYYEILFVKKTKRNRKEYVKRGHFGGQKNVLFHVRLQERTNDKGEKVLYIEEIQSDWGMDTLTVAKKLRERNDATKDVIEPIIEEGAKLTKELQERLLDELEDFDSKSALDIIFAATQHLSVHPARLVMSKPTSKASMLFTSMFGGRQHRDPLNNYVTLVQEYENLKELLRQSPEEAFAVKGLDKKYFGDKVNDVLRKFRHYDEFFEFVLTEGELPTWYLKDEYKDQFNYPSMPDKYKFTKEEQQDLIRGINNELIKLGRGQKFKRFEPEFRDAEGSYLLNEDAKITAYATIYDDKFEELDQLEKKLLKELKDYQLFTSSDKDGKVNVEPYKKINEDIVKNNPIANVWLESALKQITKIAVRNDFDVIAWPSGEQIIQDNENEFRRFVKDIRWELIDKDTVNITITSPQGRTLNIGNVPLEGEVVGGNLDGKTLENVVEKPQAKRIRDELADNKVKGIIDSNFSRDKYINKAFLNSFELLKSRILLS